MSTKATSLVVVLAALSLSTGRLHGQICDSVSAPVRCENQLPGTPQTTWDVSGSGDPTLQGFATEFSVNKGDLVRFKISTTAATFRIDIYRLGYYGGRGARQIDALTSIPGRNQPACLTGVGGLIDCGNWSESASWQVPATAVSGVYLARLARNDNGGASHIVFVVRDDAGASDIVVQTSDTTWQAYNTYGGGSAIGGGSSRASYNRPFTTRASSPENWLFNAEYPMVRWLEAGGYSVSYMAGADTERLGATALLHHRAFVSAGHDGYWTVTQRANVEAARDAGLHLAFFGGSTAVWQTHWEASIDGSVAPYRTLASDHATFAGQNALTGTRFSVACCTTNAAISVPSAFAGEPFWRGTRVAALSPGSIATLAAGTLGGRWDEASADAFRPPGLTPLSSTTLGVAQKLQSATDTYAPGTATHAMTLYRHRSGALVFSAGTTHWSWGLDGTHDGGGSIADPAMQQATINLLSDMGVSAGPLMSAAVAGPGALAAAAPAGLAIDAVAWGDHSSSQTTTTTNTFSTVAGNELLLAFVAGGSSGASVSRITGAGLTWQLVLRTNVQRGTSEIWRAFAAAPLTNVSVTATLNQSAPASIAVTSFIGADTSGTNGSGAIGATRSANSSRGAPKATLTTTRNNSWVFGVGNDLDQAIARTLGPNQTMVHQFVSSSTSDTLWTQRTSNPTPATGTSVTINDTAPTTDRYNLAICEILPATTSDTTPPTVTMTAPAAGATVFGPSVTVSATASDDVAVAGVQFTVDGAPFGAEVTSAPYTRVWDSTTAMNGLHNLAAIARDAAGNTATATAVGVTVSNDTTPPVVTLTAPAAGATISGNAVVVSANATDDTSVAGVQFLVDGATLGREITSAPYTVTWDTTAVPNGTHTLAATARDGSGHLSTASATVTVANPDSTPPAVSITSPANNAIVFGSAVTISATASDLNGIVGVQFLVDNVTAGAEDTSPPYSFIWDSTAAGNGPHTLGATARDPAGNAATATVSVTVTTPPAIYDVGAGGFTSSSAVITWGTSVAMSSQVRYGPSTAYGSTTAVDPTRVTSHGQTLTGLSTGALYHYQVVSTDAGGTTITSPDSTFTPLDNLTFADEFNGASLDTVSWVAMNRHGDFSNSEVQYYLPDNAAVGGGMLNLTSKVDASVSGYNYTSAMVQWQSFNVLYGTLEIRAKMAGGQGTWPALWLLGSNCQQTNVISADNSPPCNWPTPGSDEIDVTEILNGNLTLVNEAIHSSLGGDNCSTPTTDVSQNWHTYALVWSAGSATWKIDGVAKCTLTIAGVPSTPLFLMINTAIGGHSGPIVDSTFPQTLSVDYVRFYAQNPPDATPPTVSITAPADGATVSGTNVSLAATASDNVGVAGVQFVLDNSALGAEDTASPYTLAWNSTTATNGPHTLKAVARDSSGNKTIASVNVTVNNVQDTTPPTVSITAPAPGATVSGTAVPVASTASDNVGIVGVQFFLDGTAIGAEDTTSPYGITWNSTTVANGVHALKATARDGAGNTATATISVTVSNPPAISAVTVGSITQTSAVISWSTNVPTDSQVLYGVTSGYGSSTTRDSNLVTSHSQTLTGLTASTTYHFQAVSRDATLVTATSSDAVFTTSSLAPTLIGSTTKGSTLDSGDSNYLNGSQVTTPGAGTIVSMSVFVGGIDSSPNNQYQLAIYADASGRPGTLVASSAKGTLTANAWNTLPVSATLAAGTKYWFIYNANGRTASVNNMYYSNGSAGQGVYSTPAVTFGTMPSPFPAATITNSLFSIYATYGP